MGSDHARRIVLTGACLLLPLLACASPQGTSSPSGGGAEPGASRPATPKKVTAGILGQVPTFYQVLNPAGVRGGDALEQLVNGGLTQWDGQGALMPQLGEAVPTLENGLWRLHPDGRMETTWRIKPGASWHDGTPLTSEDLVFTLTVWRDDEIPVFRDPADPFIESFAAPDARTFTILWKQPYATADGFLNTPPLPKHLLERTYLERKGALLEQPYWTSDFVGAGPYRVREWSQGTHTLLRANEAYILGAPKISDIEVKFFVDPNTMMANILAGAIDVTIGRSVTLDEGLELREQWRDGTVLSRAAGWYQLYPQMLNPTPAIVLNPRFRAAMLHAIDRPTMVATFHGGLSTVAEIVVGREEPEYRELEPSIVHRDYDVRRASQLLEELGYRRGTDGALRDASDSRWRPRPPSTT
jgi:peptide/nickel transport system substrate-binding protein